MFKTLRLPDLLFCSVFNNLTIVLFTRIILPTINDELFDIYSSVMIYFL